MFCISHSPCLYCYGMKIAIDNVCTRKASLFVLFCLVFFRAAPAAYGGSQARGQIRATAAGLHHNPGNTGSESHLRPTAQLTATLDP